MTIDEFDALKVGDQITSGVGDTATVVAKEPHAASVRWGDLAQPSPVFHLYRQGTAWFGLELVAGATQGNDTGAT